MCGEALYYFQRSCHATRTTCSAYRYLLQQEIALLAASQLLFLSPRYIGVRPSIFDTEYQVFGKKHMMGIPDLYGTLC